MKILQAFSLFSVPSGGGTVDFVYKISRTLRQRGHEVTIYTSDFELDQNYIDSLQGIEVIPFCGFLDLPGLHITPGLISEAARNLKNFDVIHLHSHRSFQNIILHHFANKFGIPYVIDAHGSTPLEHKKTFKRFFDILYGNKICKDCSMFVAETQMGINEYKEIGIPDGKIALIPPPFPIEDFVNLPQAGQFRKEYNIKEKHIIMFFGRLNRIKGIDFLVESFYELTQQRDDVILAIVGSDDGFKSELENLVNKLKLSKKVLFTGFLGGEQKLAALVGADVVVQTSRYEQGAGVPFEAVLCGTPIIVSSHTGAGEDVRRLDAGYLVEIDNKTALAETINKILEDPTEARQKAQNAAKYIKENLSMNKKIEDYEKVYIKCIQENRSKEGK
jgi:glycosyltransferase involved in cell wall biosynthesis